MLDENPKPKAVLLNATPNPLTTLWWLWRLCKDQTPDDKPQFLGGLPNLSRLKPRDRMTQLTCVEGIACHEARLNMSCEQCEKVRGKPTREEEVAFFEKIMFDFSSIPEFVTFQFVLYNIPRTLQAQLTRHRLVSFFSQSFRLRVPDTFADDGDYFTPPSIGKHPDRMKLYDKAMESAQDYYTALVEQGVPIQDARGVLPLHTNTVMVASFNLRVLAEIAIKRSCQVIQSNYWTPLLRSMENELITKVDPAFSMIFNRPYCKVMNKCISPLEQDIRDTGIDPNPPCPLYLKHYKKGVSDGPK